jgi:hypothetical protein
MPDDDIIKSHVQSLMEKVQGRTIVFLLTAIATIAGWQLKTISEHTAELATVNEHMGDLNQIISVRNEDYDRQVQMILDADKLQAGEIGKLRDAVVQQGNSVTSLTTKVFGAAHGQ